MTQPQLIAVDPPALVAIMSASELLDLKERESIEQDLREERDSLAIRLHHVNRLIEIAESDRVRVSMQIARNHDLETDGRGYMCDVDTGRILLMVRREDAAEPMCPIHSNEHPIGECHVEHEHEGDAP